MDYISSGFPVLHNLPRFAQTHVLWVSDAMQSSHPLLPLSCLVFSLSQHQGLFQWVGSSHYMAKVLELQHQSFQWIFRMNNGIVTCIIIRESSFALFFITKEWLHSLLPPSPPVFNLSQHQGLFQWVGSSHQVAKVIELSFSISPSNKYSGLISFRIDWFDLLAVQGSLKSLL